jgi:flagellar protein FliO/FliZ
VNAVELIGRMLLALGIVLGLMWLLARYARRPLTGKADRVFTVLARQQITRNASVAVLKVADRALVIGVTDQGVQLLSETDLEQIETALTVVKPATGRKSGTLTAPGTMSPVELDGATAPTAGRGALDGSVLSAKTWRQLLESARELTVRR